MLFRALVLRQQPMQAAALRELLRGPQAQAVAAPMQAPAQHQHRVSDIQPHHATLFCLTLFVQVCFHQFPQQQLPASLAC